MIVPTLLDLASTPANVSCSTACACVVVEHLAGAVDLPGDRERRGGRDLAFLEHGSGGHHLAGRAGLVHLGQRAVGQVRGLALAGTLGSNVGALASARILPSTGITTTVPDRAPDSLTFAASASSAGFPLQVPVQGQLHGAARHRGLGRDVSGGDVPALGVPLVGLAARRAGEHLLVQLSSRPPSGVLSLPTKPTTDAPTPSAG